MAEVTTGQKTVSIIAIILIIIGAIALITSFILQYVYTKQVREGKRQTIPWWITLIVMASTALLTAAIYAAIVYGKIVKLTAEVAQKSIDAAVAKASASSMETLVPAVSK